MKLWKYLQDHSSLRMVFWHLLRLHLAGNSKPALASTTPDSVLSPRVLQDLSNSKPQLETHLL